MSTTNIWCACTASINKSSGTCKNNAAVFVHLFALDMPSFLPNAMDDSKSKSRRRSGTEGITKPLDFPNRDSHGTPVVSDAFAEDWLLLGGKLLDGTRTSASSAALPPSPQRRKSPTARASAERTPDFAPPRQQRGRRPNRTTLFSPKLWESPARQARRKTQSLEPKRWPAPPGPAVVQVHGGGSAEIMSSAFRNRTEFASVVGTPIPAEYANYIVAAYGACADLYTDVLGMDQGAIDDNITPAKLRLAYFRRGRLVLQTQCPHAKHVTAPGSSPVSIIADVGLTATSKQKFQAVTKAFEILYNPEWKAYYDAYGLMGRNYDFAEDSNAKLEPEICVGEDDIVSTTSLSSQSILRRSHSWGPATRTRSMSQSRVCWKEEVEELLYPLDPILDSSGENTLDSYHEASSQWGKKEKKNRVVIDSVGLNADIEILGQNFRRDFLDELEASLDGLGATFGGCVKYALSDADDEGAVATSITYPFRSTGEEEDEDNEEFEKTERHAQNYENSNVTLRLARQLFSGPTQKPSPSSERMNGPQSRPSVRPNMSALVDGSNAAGATTTAPLKKGNTDQSRKKPKKRAKHKKQVDHVPSFAFSDDRGVDGRRRKRDSQPAFDPFGDDQNELGGHLPDASEVETGLRQVESDVTSISQTLESMSTVTMTASRSGEQSTTSAASNITGRETLLDYDIPGNSSIIASEASSKELGVDKENGVKFGPAKTLDFAGGMKSTSQAPTERFSRLARRTKQLPPFGASRSLSASEAAADHLQGIVSSIAREAEATIRDVTSMDEADHVPSGKARQAPVERPLPAQAASDGGDDDGTFLLALSKFIETFLDHVNQCGSQISSNLEQATQTVANTFPEDGLDGMLRILETQLHCSNKCQNDSVLG